MRILHTEASLGWGGQEIRILTEAAGMIARGHSVELAARPTHAFSPRRTVTAFARMRCLSHASDPWASWH